MERVIRENALKTEHKLQEIERVLHEIALETETKLQETYNLFKKTQKVIGELVNRLGQFVEEMVKPALVRLFREKGINVRRIL